MKEGIGVTGREKGKMEGTMEGKQVGLQQKKAGTTHFLAQSAQSRRHTYGQ